MSARDEILRRIRTALADHPRPEPPRREYRGAGSVPADVELFGERVADYRATVFRASRDGVRDVITGALARRRIGRVAVPDGFPDEWLPDTGIAREPLTTAELDGIDGTLTMCALAIAETGTIVLDAGPGQGRRAFSLVPDYLLAVVRAEQVRALVPDAIAELDPSRPLTWISGPSATSDIELNRVEGVHGPRTLDVVVVAAGLPR